MMFGNIAEFLASVSKTESRHAARTKSKHGLISLMSFALFGFFKMEPGIDSFRTHPIMINENPDGKHSSQNRRQKIAPAETGDKQHNRADQSNEHRRADIRFGKNQE